MAESQLILKPVGPLPDINISRLAKLSGLSRTTVRRRLKDGWTEADLIPVEAEQIVESVQGVSTPGVQSLNTPVDGTGYSGSQAARSGLLLPASAWSSMQSTPQALVRRQKIVGCLPRSA